MQKLFRIDRNCRRLLYVVLAVGLAATAALAAELDLSWNTADGGGSYSVGGSFELEGTIGQPDAGGMTGNNFELSGGFWPGAIPSIPGDCDSDGDVDLAEYADFNACFLGPDGGLSAGCECFDFDADGDLDLRDFVDFQTFFTGP